jgi:hypothetical protein
MLLPHLAAACKAAREDSDTSLRQLALGAGLQASALSRFESGDMRTWPSRVEMYVEVYSRVAGCRPSQIWAQAIAGMDPDQPFQG